MQFAKRKELCDKMNDLISVIVPIYNAENTIISTINSIRNQDYSNLEILLIDDGSNDNSLEICYSLKKQDRRIKVHSIKNGGPSAARQYGLNKANGRYISFCDSDDTMDKAMISTLYSSMECNDSQLSICAYDHGNSTRHQKNKDIYIWESQDAICKCLSEISVGGFVWNKLFDNQIIRRFNIRFDETLFFCEDLEFVIEYIVHCERVGYVPEILYHYVYHNNNLSSSGLTWGRMTNIFAREKVLEKVSDAGMSEAVRLAKKDLVLQSVYMGRRIEKASLFELQKLTNSQLKIITDKIQKYCSLYGRSIILHERCAVKDIVNIIRFGFLKRF